MSQAGRISGPVQPQAGWQVLAELNLPTCRGAGRSGAAELVEAWVVESARALELPPRLTRSLKRAAARAASRRPPIKRPLEPGSGVSIRLLLPHGWDGGKPGRRRPGWSFFALERDAGFGRVIEFYFYPGGVE